MVYESLKKKRKIYQNIHNITCGLHTLIIVIINNSNCQ